MSRRSIYGFMRLASGEIDREEEARIKSELAEYATREGFLIDHVFTECITNSDSAFLAMINALRHGNVKDVLVPSLWHFARLPGLQEAMRLHIEAETGARLWIVQAKGR